MRSTRSLAALALALALLFSLAACGKSATQQDISATEPPVSSTEAAANDAQPSPDGAPTDAAETAASDSAPSAPTDTATEPTDAALTCTISISCATLLAHMDALDAEKRELVPPDGVLLAPTEVAFDEGESVFDLLRRVCRESAIHMEFSSSPGYGSAYIEGIGNLYEFDCGDGSGWMYRVNGAFPRVGCSQYALCAGDVIEWVYTCDLGADIGGEAST